VLQGVCYVLCCAVLLPGTCVLIYICVCSTIQELVCFPQGVQISHWSVTLIKTTLAAPAVKQQQHHEKLACQRAVNVFGVWGFDGLADAGV